LVFFTGSAVSAATIAAAGLSFAVRFTREASDGVLSRGVFPAKATDVSAGSTILTGTPSTAVKPAVHAAQFAVVTEVEEALVAATRKRDIAAIVGMALSVESADFVSRAHAAEASATVGSTAAPIAVSLAANTLAIGTARSGVARAAQSAATVRTADFIVAFLHALDAGSFRTLGAGRTRSTNTAAAVVATRFSIALGLAG
jgi:hypothetical protein